MSLKFRPDIEGLRALAILPVVLFHAVPSALPGGFVGVDVFFVISGYLITSLLLERLRSGRYSVAEFYGARVRRIFPALFTMLAVVTPLAVWLLSPAELEEFGRTLGATAVFFSNIQLYRTTGYFDVATDLKPLVHTWSLAVEEQYYIFFPLLLAFLYRRWRAGIAPVLIAVGVLSLLVCLYWLRWNPSLAFYSAVSRTCELMVGSLLAVWAGSPPRWPAWLRESASGAGVLGILSACLMVTPDTPFPGPTALWPCLSTCLVIWAGGQGQSLAGRLISCRPLRWVGALSFSLYLWHWPMLVFARHAVAGHPNAWQSALAVGLAVLLAWLSLKYVETPTRRAATTHRWLLLWGALSICLTLTVAWLLVARSTAIQGISPRAAAFYAGARDFSPHRQRCHEQGNRVIPYADRCIFGSPNLPASQVVWGDSHGAELVVAMGELMAARDVAVAQITSSSCPAAQALEVPDRPRCAAHNEATLKALVADPAVNKVVLVARYEHYMRRDPVAFEQGLRLSIRSLRLAGKDVVLVEPIPTYKYPQPAAWAAAERRPAFMRVDNLGASLAGYEQSQREALALVRRLAALERIETLPTSRILCPGDRCMTAIGNTMLYFDDNHLSMAGARLLAASLMP